MSILERVRVQAGIELPFWNSVKIWAIGRPKPIYLPRLPEGPKAQESVQWVRRRPKIVQR